MSKVIYLLRAVAACAVGVGLLVGLPFALVWFNGWPFIDAVSIVSDPLLSDNDRIAAAIAEGAGLIGWVVWFQLIVAFPQELISYRAGRQSNAVLVAPLFQRILRRLIESVFLFSSVFGSATQAAASPALPQIVEETAQPVADEQSAETVEAGTKTVTIDQTETLLSFADRELGDEDRWEELVELNNGRTMKDGTVFTEETRFLEPGWGIVVPDDTTQTITTSTVVVEKGDNQWDIAETMLASELDRQPTDAEIHPVWQELQELNEPNLRTGDPDLIYPDQKLDLPTISEVSDNGERSEIPETSKPEPSSEPDTEPETQPITDETDNNQAQTDGEQLSEKDIENPAETPTPVQPIEGSRPAAEPVKPSAEPTQATQSLELSEETEFVVDKRKVGALTLVATGAAVVALRHRRKNRSNRKPGTRPWPKNQPKPDQASNNNDEAFEYENWSAEPSILAHSDPTVATDLNNALRHLSAHVCDNTDSSPDLVAVTVDADEIKLLFNSAQPNPPEPFTVGDEQLPTFWNLDRSEIVDEVESIGLFPTLVTIGTEQQKEAVFALDLEASNVVNVTADESQDVVETMATWALELAVSPMADSDIEIVCVGFGQELQPLDNITYVEDYNEIKTRIADHVAQVDQAAEEHETAAPQGRAQGGDIWSPFIVLDPFAIDDDLAELVDLARTTIGSGLTVIVSGVEVTNTEWSLHLDRSEQTAIKTTLSYGHETTNYVRYRQNTTQTQRAEIVDDLDDAQNPAYVPQPVLYDELHEPPVKPNFQPMPIIDRTSKSQPDPEPQPADPDLESPTVDLDLDLNTVSIDPTPTHDDDPLPPWDVSAVVKVLGTLRVETTNGEPIEFKRSQSAGLAAYLTLNRHGISTDQAVEALVPNKPNYQRDLRSRRKSLSAVVSDTRKTIATKLNIEGQRIIPFRPTNEPTRPIVITELIGSDHERFHTLVDYAKTRPDQQKIGALREALDLVKGRPFGGYIARWHEAESIEGDLLISIEETALALARLYLHDLSTPDPDGAEWACQKGLAAYPESAQLWIMRFDTAIAKDPDGTRPETIWEMYEQATTDPQDGFEPNSDMADRYMTWREARKSKSNRKLTSIKTSGPDQPEFNLPTDGFDAWFQSETAHG